LTPHALLMVGRCAVRGIRSIQRTAQVALLR
jgi:hypothetical protein